MGYPGSKAQSGVWQTLVTLMPPHRVYIEGCLGGGAILRAKRPADINIGVDVDPQTLEAFARNSPPDIPNCRLINADIVEWVAIHDLAARSTWLTKPPSAASPVRHKWKSHPGLENTLYCDCGATKSKTSSLGTWCLPPVNPPGEPPDYPHDIVATFAAVDRLSLMGYRLRLSDNRDEGFGWEARFYQYPNSTNIHYFRGDAPAEAVCRAIVASMNGAGGGVRRTESQGR